MSEAISTEHLHQDMIKLQRDMSVIKHILSEEGKLTDWAKKQLKKSRAQPTESYTDIDNVSRTTS